MARQSPAVQLGSTRRIAALAPDAPFYKKLWHGWQRIARAIGNLLSRIVTTLAYLVVVPPFAIGLRLFADTLQLKPGPARWTALPPQSANLDDARSGF